MKNIYLIQPNYLYGKSAHIPYAIGTLAAFAWKEPEIKENYCLKKIQFLREKTENAVKEMENPFLVAFSTYLWNYEYNIALAKKVKDAYPECIIVFGGHQVAPDNSLFKDCPAADILIHGEGEEVFLQLLRSYIGLYPFESIPNIVYKKNGEIIVADRKYYDYTDYPSPYLTGVFDNIIEQNPDLNFVFLFESNRGCAYHCSYCDWGTLISKIRLFSEERTVAEFEWMCKNKIEFCGCADANFGMIERDSRYIDLLIELKNKTGYPKKFQASFAKNSTDRIFEIGKKLSENDMNKGVTLAFQSLSPVVLENIGRKNIGMEHYTKLMSQYNEVHIPTYTELILGLPGETYDSFADGINSLLVAGQHQSIYVHNCEMLPCSSMAQTEYVEKFKISSRKILLNEPHMSRKNSDDITEYSNIVTSTYSMSDTDWVNINIFSYVIQCFHHLGLLGLVAIYLYYEKGVSYRDFYDALIDFIFKNPESVCGSVFCDIKARLETVTNSLGSLVVYDEQLGDVAWSFEEYAFLKIISEYELFYSEIKDFMKRFELADDFLNELLNYQKNILKKPGDKSDFSFECEYDFKGYFDEAFLNNKPVMKRENIRIDVSKAQTYDKIDDYGRYVVWYGRKDSRNIYEKNVNVTYFD